MKSTNTHTNQLLKRCKKADKIAQMQLYKSYYKAMYNTAFRILKDEFEAEDIMQEAFLTAFTKLDSFKGEVTFGAWLKRIVINKSLTQLKKNKKYDEVKLTVTSTTIEEEEVTIDYNGLKGTDVLKAIQKLKENYRLVITLRLIEGYDYDEIAEILHYTNQNVRTIFLRAKKKLKQLLVAQSKNMQNER